MTFNAFRLLLTLDLIPWVVVLQDKIPFLDFGEITFWGKLDFYMD